MFQTFGYFWLLLVHYLDLVTLSYALFSNISSVVKISPAS